MPPIRKALWEYESRHQNKLQDGIDHMLELESIANSLITEANVNGEAIKTVPQDLIQCVPNYAIYLLMLIRTAW